MLKWLRKIFTISDDDIFYDGLTVKDYREMKEYHERDHMGELDQLMIDNTNEEINREVVEKLFKQNKDEKK